MVGRNVEVLKYKNVERFASYYSGNRKSLKKLQEDYSNNKTGAVVDNIRANSLSFVGNLLSIYSPLIKELARTILNKYSGTSYKSEVSRFQPAKKKRRSKVKKVKYKRKTKKGVVVLKRAKKRKWTKRQELFLKTHKKMSNKQLVKTYNSFFGKRTVGSIISKKYRIGVKKNGNRTKR